MKNLLLLSALMLFTAQSFARNQQFPFDLGNLDRSVIIGGTEVRAEDPISHMVVRIMSKSGAAWSNACTGSIIRSDLILTAAHCVAAFIGRDGTITRVNNSELLIVYGGPAIKNVLQAKPATRRDIEAEYVHSYVQGIAASRLSSGNRDFAVIKLQTPIPAGYFPAELLPQSLIDVPNRKTFFDGQTMTVILAGYGINDEVNNTEAGVMMKTPVQAQFLGEAVITDQTQGHGGCHGDSGGPAYLPFDGKLYLVGVTHGPYADAEDCHSRGLWANPAVSFDIVSDLIKQVDGAEF